MKLSLSAIFHITLFGITTFALASSISEPTNSLNQTFSLVALHPYKQNVPMNPLTIGQYGYVYADSGVGAGSFTLKNSKLFFNDEHASLGKNGALLFKPSGSAISGFQAKQVSPVGYEIRLNNTFPVACPIADISNVYQIYYDQGNASHNCMGVVIHANIF
ncbi:But2 family protein [Schizosaccharomyces octosporus yFS286]|uniref:But2 family protein n=1 Tax=Schizosaccharomyces octosporus (strain yFS286) TaxID=483514 RepID=S9QZL9_SCHOY|nr:But2 family protein [Schizosaccharomyces octosporus yFS286]EPX71695.1 But2 family protein [Schizosaccharomyces octosporus yFS286]